MDILAALKEVWWIGAGYAALIAWFVRLEAKVNRMDKMMSPDAIANFNQWRGKMNEWMQAVDEKLRDLRGDIKELFQRSDK